ncbi:MAG: UDP-N-acetylmuramoyl-L-alanine--D-glutamate ligase, partial [Quisquiliibacterium sp.]
AMARWAASRGARVSVVDTRQAPEQLETLRAQLPNVPFRSAPLSGELLDGVDALLWSPGLSTEIGDSAALHALARSRDIPVLGEIELFAQALSVLREQGYQPRVVAITGTNGKTTTTRLVGHLCQAAGISVAVAGNIAPAALDVLREAMESSALPSVWVLELSSFQLAVTDSLVADAAAILNLSQDHLDWHVSMDSYLDAKQRVYRGARVCVYNRDEPQTMPRKPGEHSGFGDSVPKQIGDFGIVHEGGLRWLATAVAEDDAPGKRRKEPVQVMLKRLMPAEALLIRGTHNQMNVLAALALAQAVGVPMARMLHGLRDFTGEEHRCQLVATIRDVQYYDDSKGTNVGATVAALGGLGRRCVLIAGGLGKGQDFSPLMAAVRDHAQA